VRVLGRRTDLVLREAAECFGDECEVVGEVRRARAVLGALVGELLGPDSSVGGLASTIAERAAGNPFFAEEMVRDLAERGVLRGNRSAYVSAADVGEVSMPATLQATIAARIDRLTATAKRTLSAAAVIGSRFSQDLLETLGIDLAIQDLVVAVISSSGVQVQAVGSAR